MNEVDKNQIPGTGLPIEQPSPTGFPTGIEESPAGLEAMACGGGPGIAQPVGAGGFTPPPGMTYGTVRPLAGAPKKEKQPYTATRADGIFACACLLLGILFYRNLWFLREWIGWGVSAFALVYGGVLLLYARAKGIRPGRASWFWLGALVLAGASYSLWPNGSLVFSRSLFLFGVALYWTGSLFGVQLMGKTGNLLALDLLNLLFVVPLRNFWLAPRSAKALAVEQSAREDKGRYALLYVLIGLVLCVPVFVLVMPLLMEADGGRFSEMVHSLVENWTLWLERLRLWELRQYPVGVLVGLYLCGLVAGCAHRRYTGCFDTKKIHKGLLAARVLPGVSVLVLLGMVSALYLLFILCQVPYYFSAFGGVLPAGVASYAEYARQGFFELCRVSALNLGLLALANCLCRTKTGTSPAMRVLNLVMVALNLVLLVTAFSKMAMYISVLGLTPKRLLTSVFMVFMALVWGAVAVLQFRQFSIVRFAAVVGSVLFCALCLSNVDGLILRYNAARYISGSLEGFDTTLVYDIAGYGDTKVLLEVYQATGDEELQASLLRNINRKRAIAGHYQGTPRDTLAHAAIRTMEVPPEFDEEANQYSLYWWEVYYRPAQP